MKWKKLILLGDSNTQFGCGQSGWVSALSDSLQRKCDVVSRGFSGYNTNHIAQMMPNIFDEFDPESTCGLVLMLGSNDSTESTNKIQHVPLEKYEKNISSIIDYLIDWGLSKEKIILVSPPRIYDLKWKEFIEQFQKQTHFDHLVQSYANVSIQVAKEKNISFLDFNKLMHEYGNEYHDLLYDGLHLSSLGGQLLFKHLSPLISQHISSELKLNFPDWKDLIENQTQIDQ